MSGRGLNHPGREVGQFDCNSLIAEPSAHRDDGEYQTGCDGDGGENEHGGYTPQRRQRVR
jgi:hypothetical protein